MIFLLLTQLLTGWAALAAMAHSTIWEQQHIKAETMAYQQHGQRFIHKKTISYDIDR